MGLSEQAAPLKDVSQPSPGRHTWQKLSLVCAVGGLVVIVISVSSILEASLVNADAFRFLITRESASECNKQADYDMITELIKEPQSFCSSPDFLPEPDQLQTSYTRYNYGPANIKATIFRGLRMDFSGAKATHDITTIAEDGGNHDPRFTFPSIRILCQCEKDSPPQDTEHGVPRVWDSLLTSDETKSSLANTVIRGKSYRACMPPTPSDTPNYNFSEDIQVLLVGRRDDHNPFFQISQILNTWIMMKALNWSSHDTQIVYIDKGIPAPTDELRHVLLAPTKPAVLATELIAKQNNPEAKTAIVEFGTAMASPYETSGPMMRHLNDKEPCQRSKLVEDFRAVAMAAMSVHDGKKNGTHCLLTIISRRNYGGRNIQRVWINEDEALKRMQADFRDKCNIQSVDFVNLTMAEQMQTIVNSDIVIGMHGAGMVNVLWSRPGTLVVEIFPKRRFRWGFRNICQRVGCDWHEFRGGQDVTGNGKPARRFADANSLSKSIPPDEWAEFINPLIDARLKSAVGA